MTGIWEKKLRDIEHNKYDPALFVNELKEQITEIVNDVQDNSNHRMTILSEEDIKKSRKRDNKPKDEPQQTISETLPADDSIIGKVCPICGNGTIIKGKSAYGCSNWQNGCKFRLPFNPIIEQGIMR